MSTNAELYEQDFYLWCLDTCATLGAREFEALDIPHLIEEIRALAGRDRRELASRLETLVMHLLKWCYQPERRASSHSWYDTILEQRSQLARLLRDNPSLRPQVSTLLIEGYADARRRAIGETQILVAVFPQACPRTAHSG